MDIEEKSIVKYRDLDPVLEYGATAYDDQYLYLTNAIRYMDYQGTVPAEGRGIMVYDFHGNLQQFIPMTQEVGNATIKVLEKHRKRCKLLKNRVGEYFSKRFVRNLLD